MNENKKQIVVDDNPNSVFYNKLKKKYIRENIPNHSPLIIDLSNINTKEAQSYIDMARECDLPAVFIFGKELEK